MTGRALLRDALRLQPVLNQQRRAYPLSALILLTLCLTACPYYNTFYNAKKSFHAAERIRHDAQTRGGPIPDQARQLYERAVENAGLIIRDHAGSDLVDDALVLIGDVFIIQQDYAKAARKFNEVLTNYPDSDLAPYCLFALGKASLNASDTTQAEESLQAFLKEHPRSRWSPEAYMLLGSVAFGRRNYEQVISRYNDFLTAYPNHDRRPEAQYYMANAYLELGRHQDALNVFRRLIKTAQTPELRFNANFMTGESLRRDGQYEEALKTFEGQLRKSEYEKYYPKIMLAIAACQQALYQTEKALAQYQKINERYEKERDYSAEAAQALFESGSLYEQQGDLQKAEAFYEQAKKRSPQNFWVGNRADEKSQDIHDLQKYRENLDEALKALIPPDSIHTEALADFKLRERVVQARFQLAEHYLFRFNMADSALAHYRQVESESHLPAVIAKAAYARAWIMEHILSDTSSSRAGYEALLRDYGATPYGAEAAQALSAPDPNGPSEEMLFARAEDLLFNAQQPDSAVVYYNRVFKTYPRGDYGPRALWAMGWIAETFQNAPDSALSVYRRLKEIYPGSEQAKQADMKIRYAAELFAELNPDSTRSDNPAPVAEAASDGVSRPASPARPVRTKEQSLPDITRDDAHGTVESIENRELTVRLSGGWNIETGTTGYVYTTDTQEGKEAAFKAADIQVLAITVSLEGKTITISVDTEVYDKPDGEVISTVLPDTPIDLRADQGDWVKVLAEGQEGFVLKAMLAGSDARFGSITCRVTRTYRPLNKDRWLGVRFDGVMDKTGNHRQSPDLP